MDARRRAGTGLVPCLDVSGLDAQDEIDSMHLGTWRTTLVIGASWGSSLRRFGLPVFLFHFLHVCLVNIFV